MTEDELERLLAQAIERELTARQAGAGDLQAIAMDEIKGAAPAAADVRGEGQTF